MTTGPEVWREFPHDPRSPEFAPMRASDSDRDIVLRTLGEAYAEGRIDHDEYDERADAVHSAKTLGELPGFLDDLVPSTALTPYARLGLDARSIDEQAVARWEKSRRKAFMWFLIPTVICWVVWALTDFGGDPWPVFPMIGMAIPVVAITGQRKDIIESNRKRIVRKQEKELRRQQRKQLPPAPSA